MRWTEEQYRAHMAKHGFKVPGNGQQKPPVSGWPPLSQAKEEKRQKYNAVPVTLPTGERFASTGEHNRWGVLQLMEAAGVIADLTRDKKALTFEVIIAGHLITRYEADFGYTDAATGERVIEDFKGVKTPAFRLKEKLMLAQFGIRIRISTRADLVKSGQKRTRVKKPRQERG